MTKHVHNQSKNQQVPEYYFKNHECKTKCHYIWHVLQFGNKKENHLDVTKCGHRQVYRPFTYYSTPKESVPTSGSYRGSLL